MTARVSRVRRAARLVAWAAVGAAVAAAVVSVVVAGLTVPLGYDEAYNLQVPRHLAEAGHYATDGSVYPGGADRDFDVFISTGPTLLLPVAGVMAVAGEQPWVVRLVPTACFLALLALAALTGRRAAGPPGALVAVLGVLGLSLRTDGGAGLQGSGDVLGEVLAAALVLGGAYVVGRHPVRAGLLVGLAVLTKLLVLVVLPAFLLVVLARCSTLGRAARVRRLAAVLLVAVAPTVAWQLLQLVVLGPGTWRARTAEFVRFFAQAGSGIVADPRYDTDRLTTLAHVWSGPPLTAVVLAVLLVAAATALARHRSGGERLTVPADAAATAWAAGGAGGLLLLWWLTVAGRAMGRYLVPPLALLLVALLPLAVLVLRRAAGSGRARWLPAVASVAATLLVGALATQTALHAVGAWDHRTTTLAAQERVAAAVRASGEPLVGVGWWQSPEIGYLAERRSEQLSPDGGVLVLSALQASLSPEEYRAGLARCDDTRLRLDGYVVCDVAPTPVEAAADRPSASPSGTRRSAG